MERTMDLAQPETDMFERNIAHLASRGREVRIWVGGDSFHTDGPLDGGGDDSSRSYLGFLAGLDERYLQVCRTDNQCFVLIDRDAVTEIEATGNSIWTYERDGLPPHAVKRIKDGCGHFMEVAKAVTARMREER